MDRYVEKQKVLTYLIRKQEERTEVLVFDHVDVPEAGTQVPAGTIDPGEEPEAAALREACEEAGLCNLAVKRYLGRFRWVRTDKREIHWRHVYHLESQTALPEQWDHTVTGRGMDEGMRFRCYWMEVGAAAGALEADQGVYLCHLDSAP